MVGEAGNGLQMEEVLRAFWRGKRNGRMGRRVRFGGYVTIGMTGSSGLVGWTRRR